MSTGFTDKLFWRFGNGVAHCFKHEAEARPRSWISLCQRRRIFRSGGQKVARPDAMMRCSLCDIREMARRGWDESGPATVEWNDYHYARMESV